MSAEKGRNSSLTKVNDRLNRFFLRTQMTPEEKDIFFQWIDDQKFPEELKILQTESKALLGQFGNMDNPKSLEDVGNKQKRSGQTINKHLTHAAMKIDNYFHPD